MTTTLSDSGLKEYLRTVVDLEKSLYEQDNLLYYLKQKLNSLAANSQNISPQLQKPSKPDGIITKIGWGLLGTVGLAAAGFVIGFPVAWIVALVLLILTLILSLFGLGYIIDSFMGMFVNGLEYYLTFAIICAVIGGVIGAYIMITDFLSSGKQRERYTQELTQYNIQVNNVKKKSDYIRRVIIPECQKEINILEDNIQKTNNLLNKLYAYDVIHPKYRTFVAVCAFHEYISTGRCTQLVGHEGAINIFESELRLNRIIFQLDEVISNLEEIKENQYTLYSMISDANHKTHRLLSQTVSRMDSVDQRLSDTNRLLELHQYNLETIARNTSAMEYYAQYEHWRRVI